MDFCRLNTIANLFVRFNLWWQHWSVPLLFFTFYFQCPLISVDTNRAVRIYCILIFMKCCLFFCADSFWASKGFLYSSLWSLSMYAFRLRDETVEAVTSEGYLNVVSMVTVFWVWLSGVRFPAWVRNFCLFQNVQNDPGCPPSILFNRYPDSFLGGKATGAWSWPFISTSAPPHKPSWPAQVQLYLFTFT